MARSVGSVDVGTELQQVVTNFEHTRQGAPLCLTMSYTMATNYEPGRKSICGPRLPCLTGRLGEGFYI